jgi:hypothetical protein
MAATKECDINLLFVPVGGTGDDQPLDYCIFREFKPRAKAEIASFMAIRSAVSIDYDQSVSTLVRL